jgi:anti-anti-sigma regulatory factor
MTNSILVTNLSQIELPMMSDIRNVGDIYNSFNKALEKDKKIQLDCSKVSRMTTPALQILIAYIKQYGEENLKLLNPSDNFLLVVESCGLKEYFNNLIERNNEKESTNG